jgi:2,3-diketo-5-methylthio-1-phosphopentane phosphatase
MYEKFFFIDFDGTITKQDSLDLLCEKFAHKEWEVYDKRWERGEIGSLENLSFAFSTFDLSKEKLDSIIDLLEVDESFYHFLLCLEQKGYGYMILSEGIDYIIKNTLIQNAPKAYDLKILKNITISANHFNGKEIVFAQNHHHCLEHKRCKVCSNCKYTITKNIQAKEKVYIGDGLSDRFGILNCDVVYAKNRLLEYCQKYNYPYNQLEIFDLLCENIV